MHRHGSVKLAAREQLGGEVHRVTFLEAVQQSLDVGVIQREQERRLRHNIRGRRLGRVGVRARALSSGVRARSAGTPHAQSSPGASLG